MSLLDLLVVLLVLVIARFATLPIGVVLSIVVALIVERLLRGERIP